MSSKDQRINSSEKDDTLNVFVEKSFANYKDAGHTGAPVKPAAPATATPATPSASAAPISVNFARTIEKEALPYFKDLIALEPILEEFTKNLTSFMTRIEEHAMFNFWSGSTLTGKTTLAKRMSGHEGFKPFTAAGVKVFYYDCFAIKDHFETLRKDWADKTKIPNNSIIFIDEVEKCLDESHKLVDETFIKKFRKFLEDLSRTRKIFFIFLSQEKATRENVRRLLDVKLTSLTDYDVKFPEWTAENLLNIILEAIDARGYKIGPKAAAALALHSTQHGMVLEMQGVLQLIDIELRRTGHKEITEDMMADVLKSRS